MFRETKLVIIDIVESLDLDSEEALHEGLADEVQRVLQAAGLADVTWKIHLGAEDEDVAGAVLNLAESHGAELLVIGARRRSPIGKFLMGSATQTIILDAPMPVLVVKAD